MSLRAFPRGINHLAKAFYNVTIMRFYDTFMRKVQGKKWIEYKNLRALTDTHRKLIREGKTL